MSDEIETVGDESTSTPYVKPADRLVETFRIVHVESILFDLGDTSPVVHLMEAEAPYRNVSIPMALVDATALHAALYNRAGRRPSTHELFSTVLARLQTDVIAAKIVRHEAGIFYAELDLMTPRGREVVDCRTSDALIVALRQTVVAPILCLESILESFNDA